MPRTPPDSRRRRVFDAVRDKVLFETDDADERHLYLCLTTGEAVSVEVEDALLLWLSEENRHVLNALLLGKATDDQITLGLDISPVMLAPYKRLFFDRSVFRNALDVIGYVRNDLNDLNEINKDWQNFYKTAIEQGPEFLINKYRVGARPPVDPRTTIQLVLNDSTDRFLTHRGQDIDSKTTKEALRWAAQALSAAAMSIDKGSDQKQNVLADLKAIMLTTVDRTETPDAAGIDPLTVL